MEKMTLSDLKKIHHVDLGYLADRIGMNAGLLRQYVQGTKLPSEKQLARIQKGITQLGEDLLKVRIIDNSEQTGRDSNYIDQKEKFLKIMGDQYDRLTSNGCIRVKNVKLSFDGIPLVDLGRYGKFSTRLSRIALAQLDRI